MAPRFTRKKVQELVVRDASIAGSAHDISVVEGQFKLGLWSPGRAPGDDLERPTKKRRKRVLSLLEACVDIVADRASEITEEMLAHGSWQTVWRPVWRRICETHQDSLEVFALFLRVFGAQPDFCCHGTYPYEDQQGSKDADRELPALQTRDSWLGSRLLRRRHRAERITPETGVVQRALDWARLSLPVSCDTLTLLDLQGASLDTAKFLGLGSLEFLAALNVAGTGLANVPGIAHMWSLAARRGKRWQRLAVLTVGPDVVPAGDWLELVDGLPGLVYFECGHAAQGEDPLGTHGWSKLPSKTSVLQAPSLAYKHFWARSKYGVSDAVPEPPQETTERATRSPMKTERSTDGTTNGSHSSAQFHAGRTTSKPTRVRAHIELVFGDQNQNAKTRRLAGYVRPLTRSDCNDTASSAAMQSAPDRTRRTLRTPLNGGHSLPLKPPSRSHEGKNAHVGQQGRRRWRRLQLDACGRLL